MLRHSPGQSRGGTPIGVRLLLKARPCQQARQVGLHASVGVPLPFVPFAWFEGEATRNPKSEGSSSPFCPAMRARPPSRAHDPSASTHKNSRCTVRRENEEVRPMFQSPPIERMTRAGFPPTKVFGGTSLVTTEPAATTAFSPTLTPPMTVAPAAIQTFRSITIGFPIVTARRCEGSSGMTRRDQAHVRPDHHIVRDVEAAEVIERAVLIDEDIAPDADFVPAGGIERRDQQKAFVDLFADELAEQGPNFVSIVERQTVQRGGDRHRPFDVCQHGRGFRRPPVNDPGAVFRHSMFPGLQLRVRPARAASAENRQV